eukprot:scaffold1177_cov192-Alexandrium_tamarense.AAC.10
MVGYYWRRYEVIISPFGAGNANGLAGGPDASTSSYVIYANLDFSRDICRASSSMCRWTCISLSWFIFHCKCHPLKSRHVVSDAEAIKVSTCDTAESLLGIG